MKVTRIAVYCRVSSDRQREEKNIQNQIQMAKETLRTLAALAKEGEIFKVVPQCPDTHSDENPSFFLDDGFNLETLEQESAFMDLVSRIRAFEVDVIWVYDVNRVFRARSNSVLGTIMDIIENHDVRIMSPLYGMLEAGPVLQILGMMGSLDKKQTLAKLHDGKFARATREGRPSNGQPGFGFLWNKRQTKWELEPGELRIMRWCGALGAGWIEKDFPESLQKVHEKFPDGAPDPIIIEALNQDGLNLKNFFERNNYQKRLLRNPNGQFGSCFLASLFRHDRYRGQYELRFKETRLVGKPGAKNLPRESKRQVLVTVPRIFSEEEWAKLKSKRMERSTWSKKFVKCEYLLKDLVICGTCGLRLGARAKSKSYVRKSTGESARTSPTIYYACIRKPSVKRKCPARSYYAGRPLDNFVWQEVRKVLAGTDSKPASSADQSLKISFMAMQESLDECQFQITGLESQRESVVTLRVRGQISDIDFTKELQRIEAEKRVIMKRQQRLKQELEAYQKASNEGVDLDAVREKYRKRVDKLTFDERQVVVRALVQNVVVQSEKEAEIFFKKMLPNT